MKISRLESLRDWLQIPLNEQDLSKLIGSQKDTLLYHPKDGPILVIQKTNPEEYDQTAIVLEIAKNNHIGPTDFKYSPDHSERVHTYMVGQHPSRSMLKEEGHLNTIATTLRVLHQIEQKENLKTDAIQDETIHLLETLPNSGTKLIPKDLTTFVKNISNLAWDNHTCLIHRDCHPKNIILNEGSCIFIDWEEAGIGSPYLDLASMAHFIPPNKMVTWLSCYLQRPPSDEEKHKLFLYLQLRVTWCVLWSLHAAIAFGIEDLPPPLSLPILQAKFIDGSLANHDAASAWTLASSMIDAQQHLEEYRIN